MRTNELIAGIRSDVAVSIYGDDLAELRRLGDQAGEIVRKVRGARGVKVEQVAGQRYLRVLPDRVRLARYGLAIEDVNTATESIAVGYDVGPVFEGQRRFSLVVRQGGSGSDDLDAMRRRAMTRPFGWKQAVRAYMGVYGRALTALVKGDTLAALSMLKY